MRLECGLLLNSLQDRRHGCARQESLDRLMVAASGEERLSQANNGQRDRRQTKRARPPASWIAAGLELREQREIAHLEAPHGVEMTLRPLHPFDLRKQWRLFNGHHIRPSPKLPRHRLHGPAGRLSNGCLVRRLARIDRGQSLGQLVGKTLLDLRRTVEDLDPSQATGVKKVLGMIPFGDKITDYFRKYQSAQSHLDGILNSLRPVSYTHLTLPTSDLV